MAMNDQEATAELERLQQQITGNLQEIDKNFAEGVRLINSVLIPNVESYAGATARIWKHCKIWLYFFENRSPDLDDNRGSTNRPPHRDDSTMGSADRSSWNHDVTIPNITDLNSLSRLRRLRMSIQKPPSTSPDSISVNYSRPPHTHLPTAGSVSTSSTTPSSINRPIMSPPRTMPFGISASSLAGTPIREAARILTENALQTAGIRSSDDDSLEYLPGSNTKRARTDINDDVTTGKAWDDTNMMEVDDPESRARFNRFFQQRQNRRIDLNEELPTWGQVANSPSNRNTSFETPFASSPSNHNTRFAAPLANTPTTDRVWEDIMAAEQYKDQEQAENDGAFEFSDALPHDEYQAKEWRSISGSDLTFHSGSNMTMVSGSTGQIPAKFDLQYFPQKFRSPPASAQLTRIYNYFAERPGSMLTMEEVSFYLDDISRDNIALLIKLLVRKKFLKKVGSNEAWTVRR